MANVSHELKTPITSIAGSVEILNRQDLTEKERDKFLEKILNHTNRMNAIINDLLRLSRIESQEEDDSIFLHKQALLPILIGAKQDIENTSLSRSPKIVIKCNDDVFLRGILNY